MNDLIAPHAQPELGAEIRVLMYAVGASGIGQTSRAIRIAEYLEAVQPSVSTLVITGIPEASGLFPTSSCKVRTLDALTGFVRDGAAPDASSVPMSLQQIADDFRPHVFVSTTHSGPVGEVVPLLKSLRRRGCRRVLALRDIYWPPRFEEDFARLSPAAFDDVIVGGPDDERSKPPRGLRRDGRGARVTYVGYLRPLQTAKPRQEAMPSFWCQVGGGRDGYALASAFLDAVPVLKRSLPTAPLALSSGVLMSREQRQALAARCVAAGVRFETWVADPTEARRATSGGVFSMGGYNSCVEAAWYGTPTIVCPRSSSHEAEQAIRASQFASHFENIAVSRSPEAGQLLDAIGQLESATRDSEGGDSKLFADPQQVVDLVLGAV